MSVAHSIRKDREMCKSQEARGAPCLALFETWGFFWPITLPAFSISGRVAHIMGASDHFPEFALLQTWANAKNIVRALD
jgi:hypothetical protein